MPKITQLSSVEAQKIAAGQVVERPANVVKELLENAIDAQATHIILFIEDGGRQRIRVIDNGEGMDRHDARACFQKHATSKITSIDQLPSVTSFGFRGEALASIAAVSKITLTTKQHGDLEGTKAYVQGEVKLEGISCKEGTDILIEDLFYNVPARAKFTKKRETETRHIIQTVKALCLAYPQLHIECWVDGKQFFNCPAQETIIGRYAQLWDTTTAKHMLAISATNSSKGLALSGAISNQQWFRYDRSGIFFLVNNRWVMNHHLSRALLRGYQNVLPNGRYPMASVAIMINPALIDINCHPRKEEVIFAHPRIIEQLIYDTVRATLETHLSKQIKKDVSLYQPNDMHSALSFKAASFSPFDESPLTARSTQENNATLPPIPTVDDTSNMVHSMPLPAPLSILESNSESYTIIGQLAATYIILETEDGLFLVDQHAAHERILYERFGDRFDAIPTINVMFPQLITCSPHDLALLEPNLFMLEELGIRIEPFGKDQLIIQSTPVHLKNAPLKELVLELIGWIKEEGDINAQQLHTNIHKKLRAQMACKGAVKAGDSLTHEQMQELIDDLHKVENRFCCPHGRPTGWLLSLNEIERKFQRRK